MVKTRVSIIIVNWNGQEVIGETLKSISDLDLKGVSLAVLVVDNNSEDQSLALIKRQFPQAQLISLKENLGFTGGNNYGIKVAISQKSDFIWFINNDTILDKNSLQTLLKCLRKDKSIGGASSKIYFARGHEYHRDRYEQKELGRVIWYAGGVIDWKNVYMSHRGVDEVDRGQYDTGQITDFLTGCSLFVRTTVLEKIGYFDESYYLYLEDVDLSLRMQSAGMKTVFCPDSVVWHVNASSSGGPGSSLQQYYQTRNRLLFGMKNAPLRVKIALLRESFRKLISGTEIEKMAVRDAMLFKFGKGYEPNN